MHMLVKRPFYSIQLYRRRVCKPFDIDREHSEPDTSHLEEIANFPKERKVQTPESLSQMLQKFTSHI